ncbi:MAG: RecX family transcriptional regulator [Armatimonadota bacterium]|nr:RecX family transcriptional regulator [Armatimonadota bacterium]MDR7426831.1 RecX family transcriptional regulator [Armatimonadota bacterium]MDR7464278.1 RecX family transcriptional regulator [Armatimonadota bacterium]MDR7468778.1 RecX family transcriptional regulator [Armatimonadota bacterium]MDR7473701.1 RecX family transcriptional regulator [Armatimonadota bacterium]
MPLVARIRPAGRQGVLRAVILADGRRFLLEADQVAAAGLFPEMAVDEGLLVRLAVLEERVRARRAALLLLRYRPRSRAEVATRLRQRGFSPSAIDGVVAELAAQGLLDDARFARAWAEHRALGQSGPARARAELRRKGVDPTVADEAVREVFAAQEADLAAALAERHLRRLSGLPVEVRLRRLAGLLRRRGFSGGVITLLLRRHGGNRIEISGELSD